MIIALAYVVGFIITFTVISLMIKAGRKMWFPHDVSVAATVSLFWPAYWFAELTVMVFTVLLYAANKFDRSWEDTFVPKKKDTDDGNV